MAIKAGSAMVKVYADNRALVRGLNRAQRRLRAFSAGVARLGRSLLAVSAAAAVPIAFATRTFAAFSDQMAEVRAVTGATEDQFAKLNAKAKTLGRTTSFTAKQVAEGMTELGRAGFKPEQIDAAIAAVLDLARATRTELGDAAQIASAAMRGFGLAASDTTRIADVLVTTANNSAQTLTDVGDAMGYVAPIAKEAGATIEDTAAALGVLANNGIKGTRAGTALARAYKNLSKSDVQKQLADIGVSAVTASGNLRKISDVLADIGKATRAMGSARKLGIFESLFGRGQAAALKLAQVGNFKDMRKGLDNVDGAARRTAKTMDNTLGGSFRMLMSAVEGVQIAIGDALAPTLRKWMGNIAKIARRIAKLVVSNKKLIVTIMKVVVPVAAVGTGLLVFAGASALAATALAGVSTAATVAALAMKAFGMALIFVERNPIVALLTLIAALLVMVGYALIKWWRRSHKAADSQKRMETAIADAEAAARNQQKAIKKLSSSYDDLAASAKGAGTAMKNAGGPQRQAFNQAGSPGKLFETRMTFGRKELLGPIEKLDRATAEQEKLLRARAGLVAGLASAQKEGRSLDFARYSKALKNVNKDAAAGGMEIESFLQLLRTQLPKVAETYKKKLAEADRVARGLSKVDSAAENERIKRLGEKAKREADRIARLRDQERGMLHDVASESASLQQQRQSQLEEQQLVKLGKTNPEAARNRITGLLADTSSAAAKGLAALRKAIVDAFADNKLTSEEQRGIADLRAAWMQSEWRVDQLRSIRDRLGAAGATLSSRAQRLATRGMFNVAASREMGLGSNAVERTANAAEKLLRINKDIRDNTEEGLAFG